MSYFQRAWSAFKTILKQYISTYEPNKTQRLSRITNKKGNESKIYNNAHRRKIKKHQKCYNFNPSQSYSGICSQIMGSSLSIRISRKMRNKKIKKQSKKHYSPHIQLAHEQISLKFVDMFGIQLSSIGKKSDSASIEHSFTDFNQLITDPEQVVPKDQKAFRKKSDIFVHYSAPENYPTQNNYTVSEQNKSSCCQLPKKLIICGKQSVPNSRAIYSVIPEELSSYLANQYSSQK